MRKNGIIEITDVKHEDCYVGYKEDVVKMLKAELSTLIDLELYDIDFEFIKLGVDNIVDIEKHAEKDRPIAVWNIFNYGMSWCYAEITLLD